MGQEVKPTEKVKRSAPSGTLIEWTPDYICLGDIDISGIRGEYVTYLEIMSYVNPGVEIILEWNNDRPIKFFHPNGVADYFNREVREKKINILGTYNHIRWRNEEGTVAYDIAYGFASRGGGTNISYVNGIHTSDGGVHVAALTEAMGILTATMNKGNYLSKDLIKNDVKITGNEIRDSLFAIIVADKQTPKFDTQIKSKLTSEDYKPFAIPPMKEQISEWIANNPSTIDKIGAHLALLAKVRYENTKNKEKQLKSGSSKTELFRNIDVKKFSDCNKSDPERCELFICEGDSAVSTVKAARDRDYQAVYALKGKVKNVIKSEDLSDELYTLIKILGIGHGDDADIRKLRYKRIIILTDADVDGYHISSLLVAFFFKHYPELIINGNVFIANAPLYIIKAKNKQSIYITNQAQYYEAISDRSLRVFSAIDKDNKTLPQGVIKYYMKALPEYALMLENYAYQLAAEPLLLEAIAMNFKDIMKGKLDNLKLYGYEGRNFEVLTDNTRRVNIDKIGSFEHFYIQIDRSFKENIVDNIVIFLKNRIKLARIRLVGKGSGKTYSEYYYEQGKLIENSLLSSGVEMKRCKGLGANSEDELRDTCMDPKTRNLTQLKISDVFDTDEMINNLFTNSDEKKDLFSADIKS